MRDRQVERLAASHGEARDGPVLPVRQDPVALLHRRHHVPEELLLELVGRRPRAGARRTAEGERPGVPRGHHHDHRLRLAGGDPVVPHEPAPPPGATGPSVPSPTPFSPFVIAAPGPLPGMSPPFSRTVSARGAKIRKVIWWSGRTSGDTTGG